jgi:hypothetical protein
MSKEDVTDVIDKNTTNTEFVVQLMNHSGYGGLVQAFVIEALTNYAENVIADTSVWPENSLVPQASWKGIAQEVSLKLRSKYGKGKESLTEETKVEEAFTFDKSKLQ